MAFKKRLHLSCLSIALLSATNIITPNISVAAQTQTAATKAVSQTQTQKRLNQLADAFYESRAKFDPLLYAGINSNNRYDNQLAMRHNSQAIKHPHLEFTLSEIENEI